ncbi:MAG: DNA-binding protein [Hymenobacter sp.]|nr:MAG: DNA-binding protein [Hymenobacter sp.]
MKEPTDPELVLVLLTLPQLRGLLSRLLAEQLSPLLAALNTAQRQPDFSDYFTTQQALDFVHLSKPTLNKLRREGRITAIRSSAKRVLYKRSELVAYLEAAEQQKGGGSSC